MNPKQQYEINHIEMTITFTKKFIKVAGILGSTEYRIFQQLRAENPTYAVREREIKKADKKQSYANLTYEFMKDYIIVREGMNAAEVLLMLDKVIALSKVQAGRYAYVKTWFLNRYPDYKNVNAAMDSLNITAEEESMSA